MAITQNHTDVGNLLKSSPDKYISLGELLKYNKPDNRDLLIKTYGDQGITGFLQLTGATRSAGVQDEVQYWEEGRLHRKFDGFFDASAGKIFVKETNATSGDYFDNQGIPCRVNDVLMTRDGIRLVVTGTSADSNPATAGTASQDASVTVKRLDGATMATDAGTGPSTTGATENQVDTTFIVIGNIHAQGTKQPAKFYQTDVTKRTNPFLITKETYHVNGSQATNIGWINIGNGDYRWYVKGEMDTRKRFLDQREMMMLFSEKVSSGNISIPNSPTDTSNSGKITGSEGYFQAVEDRGITTDGFGSTATFQDIDNIIFELDKQGAPSEYAMYVDNKTSLNIDDMLANGLATSSMTAGLPGQFGAFNNDRDMAVQLGFKSFTRGGYTFHKHDWKLLNDPTLLGASTKFQGAMVPLTQVTDARTGTKAPALELNYKESNGYSREMEHWVTGGGVLGYKTDGEDVAKFHYRSEIALVTRAANQHVIIKG